jgi:hypothetical protein
MKIVSKQHGIVGWVFSPNQERGKKRERKYAKKPTIKTHLYLCRLSNSRGRKIDEKIVFC